MGKSGPSFEELAKKYKMSPTQVTRYRTNNMGGEAYFRTLSAEEQRKILGPAKWLAWKEGKFGFDQLVKKTYSPAWGEGKGVASLKDLMGEEEAARYVKLSRIGIQRVMDNTEQPIKPEQIDFTAIDKVQYVANFGDQRGLYSVEDPGREFAKDLPVYFNQYGARHLISDDMHLLRIDWISRNLSDFLRAIEKPEFIERSLRPKRSGGYSTSHIVKVSNPTNQGDEFMLVSIWLSPKIEGGYHQIITIHPIEKRRLFRADGSIRDKYVDAQ